MSAKQFFKSTVFKCLTTLLCVLLVCGIFLTVMNSLLSVSAEERFDRAINKIYGKSVQTVSVAVADYNSNATINEAYKVTSDGGNYLVKSTGKGGFEGGTVTCWVVVVVKNGAVNGIQKVTIDSNVGQSYISKVTQSFLNSFANKPAKDTYFYTDDGYLSSGATRSSNAICNAVNGAIDFVNAQLGNVTEDIYADCSYIAQIDTRNSSHEYDKDKGLVVFHVQTATYGNASKFSIDVSVDKDGVIQSFVISKNGSTSGYESSMATGVLDGSVFVGKDITAIVAMFNGSATELPYPPAGLVTGATQSNYLCLNAAAFAAANYKMGLPADEEPDEGENNEEGGNENE
ncbi:MAG: hypothetical protein K2K80_01095 [Clostridia bacterium]|nr:hypothetical protein [Clostridia bacterium]